MNIHDWVSVGKNNEFSLTNYGFCMKEIIYNNWSDIPQNFDAQYK